MVELPRIIDVGLRRAANRWRDLRAVLAGYCNDRPWHPEASSGGGYQHWRCALRRHHAGLHRVGNYVWTGDGRTDYLPVPIGRPEPHQPWRRTLTLTRRQQRALRRRLRSQKGGRRG